MQSLNYPILILNNKLIQGQIYSESQLCMRTINSVESQLFNNLMIIDSEGFVYEVTDYKKAIRPRVILVNLADVVLDLFTRPWKELCTWIDFSLSEPKQLTFEKIKEEVKKRVLENPKWFKKSNENFETIEEKLDSYESLHDLIESLAGYP